MLEFFESDWVHVMDQDLVVDDSVLDSKITSLISCDDEISSVFPHRRSIEVLVQISIPAKGRATNSCAKLEVAIAFLEGLQTTKLGPAPNRRTHLRISHTLAAADKRTLLPTPSRTDPATVASRRSEPS